jgi:hypothetical protein
MRRTGRRTATDPFVALGADYAWRAADAVHNGVTTTSLPSYRASLTLLPDVGIGAGQVKPAVSANLNGQMSITWSSAVAYGYSAILPGSAPTAYTAVHVYRPTSAGMDDAAHGLTVGGAFATPGHSYATGLSPNLMVAGKSANNSVVVGAAPVNIVAACTYTTTATAVYANSYTAQTLADAGTLTGTTFTIGAMDAQGTFVLDGEWCTSGIFLRVLSAQEVATCLRMLGAKYAVTIAA